MFLGGHRRSPAPSHPTVEEHLSSSSSTSRSWVRQRAIRLAIVPDGGLRLGRDRPVALVPARDGRGYWRSGKNYIQWQYMRVVLVEPASALRPSRRAARRPRPRRRPNQAQDVDRVDLVAVDAQGRTTWPERRVLQSLEDHKNVLEHVLGVLQATGSTPGRNDVDVAAYRSDKRFRAASYRRDRTSSGVRRTSTRTGASPMLCGAVQLPASWSSFQRGRRDASCARLRRLQDGGANAACELPSTSPKRATVDNTTSPSDTPWATRRSGSPRYVGSMLSTTEGAAHLSFCRNRLGRRRSPLDEASASCLKAARRRGTRRSGCCG